MKKHLNEHFSIYLFLNKADLQNPLPILGEIYCIRRKVSFLCLVLGVCEVVVDCRGVKPAHGWTFMAEWGHKAARSCLFRLSCGNKRTHTLMQCDSNKSPQTCRRTAAFKGISAQLCPSSVVSLSHLHRQIASKESTWATGSSPNFPYGN